MTSYLLERAWVGDTVLDDVLVTVDGSRFTAVEPGHRGTGPATRVPGLTVPGLANCHSHAFHRALRGRTQRERGTFWSWREQMYAVAGRLDPDSYFALARATYREMAAAGITTVGEFHYLHHQPDGTPYDDPNAMGLALLEAASQAGHPDRPARHLLPQRRVRRAAGGGAGALLRRGRRPAGPNGCGASTRPARCRGRGRDPLGARGAARPARHRRGRGHRPAARTCTCPSRSPRTTTAWRPTASRRPGCWPTPGCAVR